MAIRVTVWNEYLHEVQFLSLIHIYQNDERRDRRGFNDGRDGAQESLNDPKPRGDPPEHCAERERGEK